MYGFWTVYDLVKISKNYNLLAEPESNLDTDDKGS